MRLKRFRVTTFRSVQDSGWVEADAVTALIGVNESGKTNLLLPLWKLNPVREGEIQPTSDYPKTMFGEIREAPGNYCFIEADFDPEGHRAALARLAKIPEDQVGVVRVSRFFDGTHVVEFPQYKSVSAMSAEDAKQALTQLASAVTDARSLAKEGSLKEDVLRQVDALAGGISGALGARQIKDLIESLEASLPDKPAKTSTIVPLVRQTTEALQQARAAVTARHPASRSGVRKLVLDHLPKFVYYSNYGNLDSEIYLPHVVDNLQRDNLGVKEAAKARTLRVLFRFVRLEPDEILELGRDFPDDSEEDPTDAEIAAIADKKRERSILLQSAETKLTKEFQAWWRQGDYRFDFEADGNHFRIWVSDDRRPEKVELESRSTGLQWFLSFYLVFLVESLEEHKEAVLLLDEPGLSLHPMAQRDLSSFFDGLAETNQIIYTAHSPFLMDADRVERARKVYVDIDGTTKATADLGHREAPGNQTGAAYAVHSALGITVAESLLIGCQPVIVEGASDQHYLTAIKSLLIAGGKITPPRELVFPPSGGARSAKIIASILVGRDEVLSPVLLDGDAAGKGMAKELVKGLYADAKSKVISTDEFVEFEESEVEDLFPIQFLADVLDRWQRMPETPFGDVVEGGRPVVGQIEAWADQQGVELPPHWKVELAKRVKTRALAQGIEVFDASTVDRWVSLFAGFIGKADKAT